MPRIERGQILVDRFLLLHRLERQGPEAASGLGETWLAEDSELGELVGLKIWPASLGESTLGRIEERCRPALSLRHPAIASPREFFSAGEDRVMATQYFPDGDLHGARISSPKRLAEIFSFVADALATAHANGQAHGNIHAGNVLMGPGGLPFLCDFGSCRDERQLANSPRPGEDRRALQKMLESLLRQVSDSAPGAAHTQRRLHEIAQRLGETGQEDDASTTAAFQEEFAALATEEPARAEPSAIEPTPVQPAVRAPAVTTTPMPHRESSADNSRTLILGAFGILLLIAMGVFTLLPRLVEDDAPIPSPDTEVVTQSEEESVDPRPATESPGEAWDGEAARLAFEAQRSALEEQDALKWAATEMAALREAHEAAENLRQDGKSDAAKARYDELANTAAKLQEQAREFAEKAILEGNEALESHDISSATEAYERARRIDPTHPSAEAARARLAVAEQVFALLQDAGKLERQGELASARATLTEALELDPARAGTARALARIESELNREQFFEQMSRGLDALANGQTQRARSAFEKAQAIRPESAAPGDGLVQAAELSRTARLGGLKRKAEEAERQEDYARALGDYKAALTLGPHLQFALDGRGRTEVLASIDGELNRLLADRSRLESKKVQQEATALLGRISRLPAPGPRMSERTRRLSEWLGVAETPVEVTFESDGATQVTVYRVGKLGSFLTKELRLLPGTYTVVGSRDGYRDVRRSITIEPGQKPEPILIQCKERF